MGNGRRSRRSADLGKRIERETSRVEIAPSPLQKLNERRIVVALCLLAAIRVFVYSAAFPFFDNVDEQSHFDLVMKYSHGLIPRGLEPMSLESRRYILLYGSPEYFRTPQEYPNGEFPPPVWTLPGQSRDALLAKLTEDTATINHESSQAPLYYALAALWVVAGRFFGMADGWLLYWIRFLNVFLAAALVWLGYAAARQTFPEERFMRLGVPALLAVLPQDAYYSIQNDVLSPICFGLAFIGLVQWLRSEKPRAWLSASTGLALAAACLVKVSNLPLVAIAVLTVLLQAWRHARSGRLRQALPPVMLVLACAGLPIALWAFWNLHNAGDITASAAKIEVLGWTYKPIGEMWQHPIFTLGGLSYFWSELMARFWRGEFVWGLKPLASPAVDVFYWITSAVLAGVTAISLLPRFASANLTERPALMLACFSFCAAVGYLAFLSIAFDFGNSWYPSRAYPYFTSGRLLLGALIPFLMVYLNGLNRATKPFNREGLQWWLLTGIAIIMAGSQIAVCRVAFSSQYNWFHLRGKG
jgi:Predicted membrane protein (DUF2142)